jgi:metal-responsive CopG/Arc/MetJ family transcriptional regulator
MKVKTVITLPKELLLSLDTFTGKKHKRSAIIELALRQYMATKKRNSLNKKDMRIINANADKLNEEALDVLEYQSVKW